MTLIWAQRRPHLIIGWIYKLVAQRNVKRRHVTRGGRSRRKEAGYAMQSYGSWRTEKIARSEDVRIGRPAMDQCYQSFPPGTTG